MLFSSIVFLFYFLPIVLILYYALSFSRTAQNILLLISSLIFYTWGESKYVLLMLLSIILNYILGIMVDKYRKDKLKARLIIIFTCISNLGILFVFKYLGFVIRNINETLPFYKIQIPKIILPIGISFFTFKVLSYVIDVYKDKVKVQKNIFYLGLYISFFPQLLAGPIVRYSTIENQIRYRQESWEKFGIGCCRFIVGLGKKVLISSNMAIIVDRIFTMNSNMDIPISIAWIGSFAYTFQIFFDFSGYSDMAIGLGLMFGFKFDENFNYPYISKSITEFWRRWHISLGSWFRDYVYFPLGGSRVKNKDKIIRNLFIVWVLTGVWHGAEWTFIIWGFLNFIFIAIEKILIFDKLNISKGVKHLYTLFIINLGWVLFRSKDLIEAGKYISNMFGFNHNGFWSDYTYMFIKENIVFWILAIIFSTPIVKKANKFLVDKFYLYREVSMIYPAVIIGLFFICVCYLVKGTYNPFIYFNF